MDEGWLDDIYLVLFSSQEALRATERYRTGDLLPEYAVAGLAGWDDFILCDSSGGAYCAPTVPLTAF